TAKKNNMRARFNFSESQSLEVLSPRVGLIILYDTYFNTQKFGINRSNPKAYSNSLNRISTLLHEARHSDGNGPSLGFPHVKCPATKPEYEGFAACDIATNGAYAIEAAMHKKFIEECI